MSEGLLAEAREQLTLMASRGYIKLSDVLAVLGEAEKSLREAIEGEKVSVLEMFCYQGPPTKRWIETKGEFWKGWNACCDELLKNERVFGDKQA